MQHVENIVEKYFQTLKEECGLEVFYLEFPEKSKIITYKVENFYPSVASIELTHKCNLKCLHCYGDYGENKSTMSFEKAKKLLRDLKQLGVKIVEFTGGDITMRSVIQLLSIKIIYMFKLIYIV